MNPEDAFIAALLAAPGDDTPRHMYADWLRERGDARADYLRAEAEWARKPTGEAETRLREAAAALEPVWVAGVSRPPLGVCADRIRFHETSRLRVRPRCTTAELDWMEKRFGLTLPAEYRAFLLNFNGGRPEPSHFRIPERRYGEWGYDEVLSLATGLAAADSEIDWDCDLVWRQQEIEQLRADDDRWRGVPPGT
jgi:uncharacterized protein (TIGR02996 family)